MEKILRILQNWWLLVLLAAGAILDYGFDALKPLLQELNIDDKYINCIRLAMVLFSIIRMKLALPTQNADKLQKEVNKLN